MVLNDSTSATEMQSQFTDCNRDLFIRGSVFFFCIVSVLKTNIINLAFRKLNCIF